MKAIVIHAARDLRIEDRAEEAPGPGQVRLRLATGGVCGSDLHYYNHGGFGAVRLREPMILGHEVSAHVEEVGAGVEGLAPGQLVAVSPARPCGACRYCLEGLPNECLNMRFYGSAMPFPHIQGAFREALVADASQCVDATGLTPGEAAMAEPLAVTLHATRRAGEMLGKRVLVTGCGPIGLLAILSARRAGASEIVATDLSDFTLAMARKVGADRTVNMGTEPEGLSGYTADKGWFDVLYECSGAAPALAAGIAAMRPRGGDRAARPRRGHAPADDGAHREGARPAGLVPVPQRVRGRRPADAGRADRREAADHPHRAPRRGRDRLQGRRRPDAGDEGANQLRLRPAVWDPFPRLRRRGFVASPPALSRDQRPPPAPRALSARAEGRAAILERRSPASSTESITRVLCGASLCGEMIFGKSFRKSQPSLTISDGLRRRRANPEGGWCPLSQARPPDAKGKA